MASGFAVAWWLVASAWWLAMWFANTIMLFGLAAMAIPIVIHILNRRRAQVVDWGAMQFLAESLASRNRRILIEEILLMVLRCLVLGLLVLALARPYLRVGRLLAGGGQDPQDVAIVLDGSLSMTLDVEGASNFQRAIDEAHQVVDACRASDAVSLVLAGPTAQAVVPSPLSDRQVVHRALDELTPTGGSMGVVEALQAATLALAAGTNPAKKIVLITDGQGVGWDLGTPQRWQFLSEAANVLPTRPTVIVRTLSLPRRWSNACAAGLSLSRAVIGTDRPVKVTVTVANTGIGKIEPQAVELAIDGRAAEARKIGAVEEGSSVSVVFEPRFDRPGPHVVAARVVCEDDLPGDNETIRVVEVLEELAVLIVQGQSSPKSLESDGDFLRVAMSPPEEKPDQSPEGASGDLLRPTVVDAADVARVKDYSPYAVVVLANVPRLPGDQAARLAEFVAEGGGLLIAPGEACEGDFYARWNAPDGKALSGCRLARIEQDQRTGPDSEERFAHVAASTINHPALRLLADPAASDLASARIKRHWVLQPDDHEAVTVGACLDSGDPFLVQRKVGRGYVLTLALPLDTKFSDLPVNERECFVPMVHELAYYLAAPSQRPLNLLPGQPLVYAVPGAVRSGDVAEVVEPDGRRTPARLEQRQGRWQATYALTARPGLYRLVLPAPALGSLARVLGGQGAPSATETAPSEGGGIPFLVLSDPNESTLEPLSDSDFQRAGRYLHLARAETLSELTAAVRGHSPVREIWQYLALAVLALVVAEIVATRTIAVRRKIHQAAPVEFGTRQVDAEGFRSPQGALGGVGVPRSPRGQFQEANPS